MITFLKRKLRSVGSRCRRWLWPPTDVYATHVPILIGLARLRPVRRVLEFGCGPFSTLTFLDRAAYPDLTDVLSYETDPQWEKKLRTLTKGDLRLRLQLVADHGTHG